MHNEQLPVNISPDALHEQAEQAINASLFEQHKNTVITAFGMTGTIGELLDKCPMDPSLRNFEATEAYTAKLLEKNNIEVPELFAHLRSEQPKDSSKKNNEEPKAPKSESKSVVSPVEVKTQNTITNATELVEAFRETKIEPETHRIKEPESEPNSESDEIEIISGGMEQGGGGPSDQDLEAQSLAASPSKVETHTPSPKPVTKTEIFVEKASKIVKLKPELPSPVIEANQIIKLMPELPIPATEEPTVYDVGEPQFVEPAPMLEIAHLETAAAIETAEEQIADLYQQALTETTGIESPEEDPESAESEILETDLYETTDHPKETNFGEGRILNLLSIDLIEVVDDAPAITQSPLLSALPPELESLMVSALESAEPQAEELAESVESMTLVAERLQVLIAENRSDSPEAQQIEVVLIEYFDQLCLATGWAATDEEREAFIGSIKQAAFEIPTEAVTELSTDSGTHEFKNGILVQAQQLPDENRITLLAGFMMRLGNLLAVA